MEKNNNTIRLTEQEFNKLISEAVMQVINEGKFGNFAKKVGKGLGKAALYGALGAGSLYALDKGMENQEKYEQSLNKQGMEMQGPNKEDVAQWLEDHQMSDTPQNREMAWQYLTNESKANNRLAQIIREEINKVL